MAFPVVASTNHSEEVTDVGTHTVLAASGIQSGDLLLIFIATDGNPTIGGNISTDGYTQLDRAVNGTVGLLETWGKIADGTEGDTSFTTSVNEESANYFVRITGWAGDSLADVEFSADVDGTTSTPDPASLTPSWGALDTLWFAAYGAGAARSAASFPTNYGLYQHTVHTTGSAGCGIGVAGRELNATSDNPGTFDVTNGSANWTAITVGVKPAAGGAFDPSTAYVQGVYLDVNQAQQNQVVAL